MKDFEDFLRKNNLAEKTISSYLFTIKKYFSIYDDITKKNLLTFKGDLVETYKPKTVNLRIQAVNKYLDYVGKENLEPMLAANNDTPQTVVQVNTLRITTPELVKKLEQEDVTAIPHSWMKDCLVLGSCMLAEHGVLPIITVIVYLHQTLAIIKVLLIMPQCVLFHVFPIE